VNTLLKIDFSVSWDGRVSVRYRNEELLIRDHLYRYLLEQSKEGGDLTKEVEGLEKEMGQIMKKSLGVVDLQLKITEIRYL